MAAFLAHSSLTYSLMIYFIVLKIFYRILLFYLMDQIKIYFIQLFRQRLSHESVKAYATMPICIMGSKSLALLDIGSS